MMLRLAQAAQIILCLVSMVLTGLFALSLSGIEVINHSVQVSLDQSMLLALIFIVIGCCIDVGKYLFWSQRHRSFYYGALSLVLMSFSWLASCAFLVSSENELLRSARVMSADYAAIQQRIEAVQGQIDSYEDLIAKRLSSSYHQQWAEGQGNVEKVAELKASLATMIESSATVGNAAAQEQGNRSFQPVYQKR